MNLSSTLARLLARFAFFFEPISPRFVSLWLRRRLKNWKDRGLISGYELSIRRKGKFHYKIKLDLELNKRQAERILEDMSIRIQGRFRR